jgi:flagellar protein FliJ
MTKWAASLIRISTFEVETLQKRLADIVERRTQAQMRIAVLDAEAEIEAKNAEGSVDASWYMIGYRQGLKHRKAAVHLEIEQALIEEAGARDALSLAFEALKKYEHVAQNAKIAGLKLAGKLETAAMDELGLRKAAMAGR